ncbi:hypothetical protein N0V84_000424 [Fusarium piperis]|uniref:Uncharacterized protein n=1 Tax=Fusarium piperis TaxID=1435070 RepID=A0A9W8WMV2_9HYPO|nr:hypothetical protein N0V84_000424 [Fusarium piperis]
MAKVQGHPSTPRGKKRGRRREAPEVKKEHKRPPPALRPKPSAGTQKRFVITRQDAIRRAGGLEYKLGNDAYNQMELTLEMKRWLSKPVIMVLTESMKRKVFDWCQQFDPSWLGVLFEAKGNGVTSYEYSAEEEEPVLPETLFQSLRTLVLELPSDKEAYKRLWPFVQLVTTHAQRVFLMDELEQQRPDVKYDLEGQGLFDQIGPSTRNG